MHCWTHTRVFIHSEEGTNVKAWLFRILYNRWVSTYRRKQRRPAEVSVEEITERDLASSAARVPAGLRSAEAEVLEALPDSQIQAAMQICRRPSGQRCTTPTSTATPTRRPPRF